MATWPVYLMTPSLRPCNWSAVIRSAKAGTSGSDREAHMESWDVLTDFISIGSGGGGMVGALAARGHGLQSIIIEKREVIGGSTAKSGGVMWIPNNPLMGPAGVHDSYEDAMAYFDDVV